MVIERFLQYIENKGLKLAQVERDLGFSNGYLGKQRDRKASIGSNVIEKIVSAYPDLNIQWFITGEGTMISPNAISYDQINCKGCIEKERLIKSLETTIDAQQKTIQAQEKLIKVHDSPYKQTASG